MKSEGVVLRLDGEYAIVGVKRLSACDTCRAKCGGHCDKASTVETKVKNDLGAKVGDTVALFTNTTKVLLYAFSVFLLPIIMAFAGYFLAVAISKSTTLAILFPIILFVMTFFVIWLIWGKKDANSNIKIIEIKGQRND